MHRNVSGEPTPQLTPEQTALCIEARRAYYRASAALDQFENTFKFLDSYRDFGRLPKYDWDRIAADLCAAQAAAGQFDTLMGLVETAGIDRDTAMLVDIPQPATELDLAMEAHRRSFLQVKALLRVKPTPEQRRRSKAVAERRHG